MSVDSTPERVTVTEDLVELTIAGVPHLFPAAVADGILRRRDEIAARRKRFAIGGAKKMSKRPSRRRRRSSRSSASGSWRSVYVRPPRGHVRLFG